MAYKLQLKESCSETDAAVCLLVKFMVEENVYSVEFSSFRLFSPAY